jgi:hypothetical protein
MWNDHGRSSTSGAQSGHEPTGPQYWVQLAVLDPTANPALSHIALSPTARDVDAAGREILADWYRGRSLGICSIAAEAAVRGATAGDAHNFDRYSS